LLIPCWRSVPALSRKTLGGDLPKLEKFDASLIDKSKDACNDFFQYTCAKWIAAHPIPADMPLTSVGLPLYLYNQTILRQAMEKAASNPQAVEAIGKSAIFGGAVWTSRGAR